MTVNKFTDPPTQPETVQKINEIIDNLGGGVDIDNTTITENLSNKIQTVAVIDNQSGNAIKTWTGTRVQYDAIVSKDANTLYNITDDTDVTLTLLEALYPVGAIYIGTMANCPLATLGVGTWQLIAADRVLQGAGTRGAVGTTINESLPKLPMHICGDEASGYGLPSTAGFANRVLVDQTDGSQYLYGSETYAGTYVQQDAYLVNIWERTA